MLAAADVLPTVHVLLDALTAWDRADDRSGSVDEGAIQLAVRGLPLEALDVSVSAGEHTVDVDVDFSVLLGGALLPMRLLVEELAATTGRTEQQVISDLRHAVTDPEP